jgi:phosphohistidine phosphatase
MLELYLIRHGIAAPLEGYASDRDRPLTDEGKQKTKKVAQRLAKLDLHFDLILTSPLLRARQTAEILQGAGLSSDVEVSSHLAFDGNIHAWLAWLENWPHKQNGCLALVGHEPSLAAWAETLIWGQACGNLSLKKAGIIGLELPQTNSPVGNSQLFWLTPPRLLL